MSSKKKTWILITILVFFTVGITASLGDKFFGVIDTNGNITSKDITMNISVITTFLVVISVYRLNPFGTKKRFFYRVYTNPSSERYTGPNLYNSTTKKFEANDLKLVSFGFSDQEERIDTSKLKDGHYIILRKKRRKKTYFPAYVFIDDDHRRIFSDSGYRLDSTKEDHAK